MLRNRTLKIIFTYILHEFCLGSPSFPGSPGSLGQPGAPGLPGTPSYIKPNQPIGYPVGPGIYFSHFYIYIFNYNWKKLN